MDKKLLTISFAGFPNVGKSTLLNAVIGEKVAIVTHKVQTTRKSFRGIKNMDDTQLVFIDTPGLFETAKFNNLQKNIIKNAKNAIKNTDITGIIFDINHLLNLAENKVNNEIKYQEQIDKIKNILSVIYKRANKLVFIINKIDLIQKEEEEKLNIIKEILLKDLSQNNYNINSFPVSAITGEGIVNLLNYFQSIAKNEPWLFLDDLFTDTSERELAEELTREQIFLQLNKELPYSIKVETEKWEEQKDGSTKIYQVIFVLRESQKKIVLGEKGNLIRSIGEASRIEISHSLNRPIHLFLHVKIAPDWIENIR